MQRLNRQATAVLASAVLLISLASLLRLVPRLPGADHRRYIGIGQVLAVETVKAVQDHGRVVAVINPQHNLPGDPAHDEWESFQAGLKTHRSVQITATEVVEPDPSDEIPGAGCSRYQLKDILDRHGDADAIVFLFSLPEWPMAETAHLHPVHARILVADHTMLATFKQYGGYFTSGIISVLISRRSHAAGAAAGEPRTPEEAFAAYYEITTPKTSGALAE